MTDSTPDNQDDPTTPQPDADGSGYWEQQAAEAASQPAPEPGVQFNPQSGYPVGQQPPPPYYPPPGYGQQGYPPPYGQQGQPAYPYYGQPTYVAPDNPRATTALILGLVGTVGALMCILPVFAAPFAWVLGVKARREIRASNGQQGGHGNATAGMVLGIIGTVVLVVMLALVALFVVLVITDPNFFDESYDYSTT